jgi:thymidylate synthase (FAD)
MLTNAAEVESLRWKKLAVLDDGFVCLVDCMGDDQAVVQAARVSYGEGTRKVSDDRGLIRYLIRHRHTTPFEMAEIKLLVRVPMDTWRQWIRHRMASVNEYSTRYSIAIDAAQATPPGEWRRQAAANRQGSEGALPPDVGTQLSASEKQFQNQARALYEERLELGVAREQARKDLPLSTYTEAYWKIDLHNLLHFLELRMDAHAQWEIRQYATAIGEQIVRPLFPLVWEAFVDYRREAIHLTRLDREVIARLMQSGNAWSEGDFLAVQDNTWADLTRCRERDECRAKLMRLGVLVEEPSTIRTIESDAPERWPGIHALQERLTPYDGRVWSFTSDTTDIHVVFSSLTDDQALEIADVFQLIRFLDISQTQLTDAGLAPLVASKSLYSIRLSDKMSHSSIERLFLNPELHRVTVSSNKLAESVYQDVARGADCHVMCNVDIIRQPKQGVANEPTPRQN